MAETNFQFLEEEFSNFYDRAVKAEQLVITDPSTSIAHARLGLELAINWMYKHE